MFSRFMIIAFLGLCSVILSGCGSITGLPGHGGGKRFAIEQELVSASVRATIKQIDFSELKGKKVNLYVNTIGDSGSGNLLGGRFSVISQLRGQYVQTPEISEISRQGALSDQVFSTSEQSGSGGEASLGVEYKGLGSYQNSEEITSSDLRYLAGLLESYLFLQGVHISPPSEAEVDVYVTVDVFGTIRTRVDWFLANNEILRSKTAVEVIAVKHSTGELLMGPQAASTEAEYNEQYVLWSGPVSTKKFLKKADPLMCDFTNLPAEKSDSENWREFEDGPDYPFRYEIEKRKLQ